MFWNNLTRKESDRYIFLIKKVDEWIKYCQAQREFKEEIDHSRDLSLEDYKEWDKLSWKFWNK